MWSATIEMELWCKSVLGDLVPYSESAQGFRQNTVYKFKKIPNIKQATYSERSVHQHR